MITKVDTLRKMRRECPEKVTDDDFRLCYFAVVDYLRDQQITSFAGKEKLLDILFDECDLEFTLLYRLDILERTLPQYHLLFAYCCHRTMQQEDFATGQAFLSAMRQHPVDKADDALAKQTAVGRSITQRIVHAPLRQNQSATLYRRAFDDLIFAVASDVQKATLGSNFVLEKANADQWEQLAAAFDERQKEFDCYTFLLVALGLSETFSIPDPNDCYANLWQNLQENSAVRSERIKKMAECFYTRDMMFLLKNRVGDGSDGLVGMASGVLNYLLLLDSLFYNSNSDARKMVFRAALVDKKAPDDISVLSSLAEQYAFTAALCKWCELTDAYSGRYGEGASRLCYALTQMETPIVGEHSLLTMLERLPRVKLNWQFVESPAVLPLQASAFFHGLSDLSLCVYYTLSDEQPAIVKSPPQLATVERLILGQVGLSPSPNWFHSLVRCVSYHQSLDAAAAATSTTTTTLANVIEPLLVCDKEALAAEEARLLGLLKDAGMQAVFGSEQASQDDDNDVPGKHSERLEQLVEKRDNAADIVRTFEEQQAQSDAAMRTDLRNKSIAKHIGDMMVVSAAQQQPVADASDENSHVGGGDQRVAQQSFTDDDEKKEDTHNEEKEAEDEEEATVDGEKEAEDDEEEAEDDEEEAKDEKVEEEKDDDEEDEEKDDDEEDFSLSTLWPVPSKAGKITAYVAGWHYYDNINNKLGDFTYELADSDDYSPERYNQLMRDELSLEMQRNILDFYPWEDGNEFLKLQKLHGKDCTLQQLWAMSFDELFDGRGRDASRRRLHEAKLARRLQHSVAAAWPINASKYLVHWRRADREYEDRLADAFSVEQTGKDVGQLNKETLLEFNAADYPWQDGATGLRMIKKNAEIPKLTASRLKRSLERKRARGTKKRKRSAPNTGVTLSRASNRVPPPSLSSQTDNDDFVASGVSSHSSKKRRIDVRQDVFTLAGIVGVDPQPRSYKRDDGTTFTVRMVKRNMPEGIDESKAWHWIPTEQFDQFYNASNGDAAALKKLALPFPASLSMLHWRNLNIAQFPTIVAEQ